MARRRGQRRRASQPGRRPRYWFWCAAVGFIAIGTAGILAGVWLSGGSAGTATGIESALTSGGSGARGELSQIRTADFHSLAVSPLNPEAILYGHHEGVLRSADGGRTWQDTNLGGAGDDAMGIAFVGSGGLSVVAAGHNAYFTSNDGGLNWQPFDPALPATDIHGLAAAPDDPNRLYVNVVGFGLFRSNDGGATWQLSATILPGVMTLSAGPVDTVYAASMDQGILRSDDGGQSFQVLQGAFKATTVAAAPSDRSVVYAGTDGGVMLSSDGGAAWQKKFIPGEGRVVVAAVSPIDPMVITVVAVQSDGAGHVFRSTDGGTTWGPS